MAEKKDGPKKKAAKEKVLTLRVLLADQKHVVVLHAQKQQEEDLIAP